MEPIHVPVMVAEVLQHLEDGRPDGLYVDCTLGLGGHASALLERKPDARLIGVDRDEEALELARERLSHYQDRIRFVHSDYSELSARLESLGIDRVRGIYADLGVSSLQLDRGQRGFSFRKEGPLDMRMDSRARTTAKDVVNGYSLSDLDRVLRRYGEERRARRIARAVVEAREEQPIETTSELREVVHRAVGSGRRGPKGRPRIDSATRTFQALRIEVNQELAGLERLLEQSMKLLESGGRLVVISYHSLEDRIVKHAFRSGALGEVDPITGRARTETRLIELLTRKPERPSDDEVRTNPRARSARLRAVRRL